MEAVYSIFIWFSRENPDKANSVLDTLSIKSVDWLKVTADWFALMSKPLGGIRVT